MIPATRPGVSPRGLLETARRHATRVSSATVFAGIFLVFLAIAFAQLAMPGHALPPLAGDSAKYHALAEGIEHLCQHPGMWGPLLSGRLSQEERDRLGIDHWEFQHAPAYIIPLGIGYALLPNNEGVGRAFSLLFYALSAGVIYLIGRRLLGPLWCWLPVVSYLLYTPLLYYATGILTETFGVLATLTFAYVLLHWHRRPCVRRAMLLGLAVAFLYFAKTTFRPLVLLFVVGESLFLLGGGFPPAANRRRAASCAHACERLSPAGHADDRPASPGPVPGPRDLRRRRLLVPMWGAFLVPLLMWYGGLLLARVPLEGVSQSGESQLWLYRGNQVSDQGWETTAMGDPITPILEEAGEQLKAAGGDDMTLDERQRGLYTRAFWIGVRADPIGTASLAAKKFHLFWTYPARKDRLPTVLGDYVIPHQVHLAVYGLGLLGFALLVRRSIVFSLPGWVALGVAVLHALSHLVARYNIPVLPLWGIMAAVGLRGLALHSAQILRWSPAGSSPAGSSQRGDFRRGPRRSTGIWWGPLRRARIRWGDVWRGMGGRWLVATVAGVVGGSLLVEGLPGRDAATAMWIYRAGAGMIGLGLCALGPFLAACSRIGERYRPHRRSALWLSIAPALFAAGLTGVYWSEQDWDEYAVTLRSPGDSVIQRLPLGNPNLVRPDLFEDSWLEIDMLQSERGRFTLEIWAQGQLLKTFTDSLGAAYESFLFDPAVHPGQDRYRRLADTLRRFVEHRLEPEAGKGGEGGTIGFDYFRRWVRVPLSQELLGGEFLEVELRLTNSVDGGWVRVYGDRFPGRGADRRTRCPAMGENPNEFSHYRAEFFAGDRERMDGRLIRPVRLWSPFAISLARTKSQPHEHLGERYETLRGELRIRLRVALVGTFVIREDEQGTRQRIWTVTPRVNDEIMSPAEMRTFRWFRESYFDGTWIY